MRRALIAAAVTSRMVAARRRRHLSPPLLEHPPVLPTQRAPTPSFLDDDAGLSLAEQQAQDDRILDALDRF